MYISYARAMSAPTLGHEVSTADFRSHLGEHFDAAQREPVTVTSRGRARGVLVSPDFFDRALRALEDAEDVAAAAAARAETEPRVSHEELRRELGLDGDQAPGR